MRQGYAKGERGVEYKLGPRLVEGYNEGKVKRKTKRGGKLRMINLLGEGTSSAILAQEEAERCEKRRRGGLTHQTKKVRPEKEGASKSRGTNRSK